MSRIYDALKKAERERQGLAGPEPGAAGAPAAAGAAPAAVGGEVPPTAWGVVPPELLKELSGVRRVLEASLPDRTRFALGVLSSVPGEGVTTTLLGFARTLVSDARLRVLLVDADSESHQLSRLWAEPGAPGWSDLSRPDQAGSAIRPTPLPGLHVLPFGSRALVSPAQLAELLVEGVRLVAQQFDYVLFDCGSVLQTPLTRYLARAMDGVLLVVHASSTRREICLKAVEELRQSEAPVLGVVLNRRRYVIPEALYKRI